MENKPTRKEEIDAAVAKFPKVKTENLMEYIVPRGKSVIVKERPDLEREQLTSSGGLTLVASENSVKSRIGVIVSIGPDVDKDLEVGQLVYFNQFANLQVVILGNIYIKMNDFDVYFHLNPEGTITYVGQGESAEEKKRHEGFKENVRITKEFQKEIAEIPDKLKTQKKTGKIIIGKGGNA